MNKEFEEWWEINENEIGMSLDGENFYAESWANNAKNLFKNCFEAGAASAQEELKKLKKQITQQHDINMEYYHN